MNLPKLNAENSTRFQNKPYYQTIALTSTASNPDEEPFNLIACYRPVWHKDKRGGTLPLHHCYAKIAAQDGTTVDSISYDGPTGVSQSSTPDQETSQCQIVKSISKPQWEKFTKQVYQQCQSDNYSLASNNCCSCLGRVFMKEVGYLPNPVQQAHAQIESNRQYVIL
jgi:hypothetical protein